MKKTLEKDLTSLARRIIKMDDKASVSQLKEETRTLYEKLTLLEFVNKNIGESSSGLQEDKSKQSIADQFEVEHNDDHYNPDGTEYNPEAISEPNTEKIKDIVSQMPPETQQVDHLVDSSKNETDQGTNQESHSIVGVSFDDLPDFEPAHKPLDKKSNDDNNEPNQEKENKEEISGDDVKENEEIIHETRPKEDKEKEIEQNPVDNSETRKKSLNNKLIKDIKLGLNNRLAFTRHLFDGDKQALRDCVKNINKCKNLKEVKLYVEQDIKPQYDYWKGKEKYEERFFDLIETKFPD